MSGLISALVAAALIGLMSFWVQEAAGLLVWMAIGGVVTAAVLLVSAHSRNSG